MTTKHISPLAASLLATTLGVGAALAQDNQTPARQMQMKQSDADHHAMMDMSRMNRMMDSCNGMMESMQQHPRSEPSTTVPDKG